jgi:tyrosine-protein kinase Etk/Wzc
MPAAAPAPPPKHFNPVLQSQLRATEDEIAKHKSEQQRLSKLVSTYRGMLDAIPVREQEVSQLVRNYEISKAHYAQLLEKELAAKTATELELRQKGENFLTLDRALPAERPSRPNRVLIDVCGSLASLIIGLLLATGKEFVSLSIIVPKDIAAVAGDLAVLGVIPIIRTQSDQRLRRRRALLATSAALVMACGVAVLYFYRGSI